MHARVLQSMHKYVSVAMCVLAPPSDLKHQGGFYWLISNLSITWREGKGGGEEGRTKKGHIKKTKICETASICWDWLAAVAWPLLSARDGMSWAGGGGEEQDDSGAREKDVRRVLKRAAAAGWLCVFMKPLDTGWTPALFLLILIHPQLLAICTCARREGWYLSLLLLFTAINLEML